MMTRKGGQKLDKHVVRYCTALRFMSIALIVWILRPRYRAWRAMERFDFFRAVATCRPRMALVAGIAILLVTATIAAAAEPKRVMLLHSFGREFKPWSEYAKAIRAELDRQSSWPLDITDQSLVTARSSDDNSEGAFVEYLRALYGKNGPDLIVSIGAPAADGRGSR